MPNVCVHKVLKISGSLAVIIPAHYARTLNIARGDSVTFAAYKENELTIRRLTARELKAIRPTQ